MKIPSYDRRTWFRVFVKAAVLFLIFDMVFIGLDVPDKITSLSVYGSVVPYRSRLIMFQDNLADQLLPLEALLAAHEIARPKAPDEFRVVLLGDSGVLGASNLDENSIPALMTAAGQSLQGKHIRAYNLAYPVPSATRDMVIADATLAYQPDLIIWFVTLAGFRNDTVDRLVEVNAPRMTKLTTRFGLTGLNSRTYGHYSQEWWGRSIWAQKSLVYRWLRLQTYYAFRKFSFKQVPAGIILNFPIPEEPAIRIDDPAFAPMPNPNWASLTALPQLTRTPILIVNEPILVMPNAGVNYNLEIGREIYDRYRDTLHQYCSDHTLWCLDIWNTVPVSEYTDSTVHRTAAANAIIIKLVLDEVQKKLGSALPGPSQN